MKKSQFTEQQIAFALQQAEAGTKVEDICRKLGICQATFFRWKKMYGGLMPSEVRNLRSLEEAKRTFGLPHTIRVDNGCQFTSKELDLWAYANSVTLDFSRPGKPTDNAYAESFNATVRLECLGQNWFMDLDDAVPKVEEWRREYTP